MNLLMFIHQVTILGRNVRLPHKVGHLVTETLTTVNFCICIPVVSCSRKIYISYIVRFCANILPNRAYCDRLTCQVVGIRIREQFMSVQGIFQLQIDWQEFYHCFHINERLILNLQCFRSGFKRKNTFNKMFDSYINICFHYLLYQEKVARIWTRKSNFEPGKD